MLFRKKNLFFFTSIIAIVLVSIGCSSNSSFNEPKDVVIGMFGAMERNDKAALAHILDLDELMKIASTDYALNSDNPRVFNSPLDILEDLTDEGYTKTKWFSYQRIVNKQEIFEETATVEVTFMDKKLSKAYLVKFGVHIKNDKWKIYSFNILSGSRNENN